MTAQLMTASRSLVILVDHQVRLMTIIADAARVTSEATCLAEAARLLGVPVVGTEHNPAKLGPLTSNLRQRCDFVMPKLHFNACEDGLIRAIKPMMGEERRDIVIAGCETHVCLLQSAMGLLDAGFTLHVVENASGSRTPSDHELAMQRLQRAGANVVSTEMILFEWLRTCAHPQFRAVLRLVKDRYPLVAEA